MKYRKLFFLSLPLSLLGLKRIIEQHHHVAGGHYHGRRFVRDHMMKLIVWRLGLLPEQRRKMEELSNRMKAEFKPFTEKHDEMRRNLTQEFRKEQFETDRLRGQFTPEMVEKGHDLLVKGIGEFHDILTPIQRDKVAAHFERHHCH